MQSSLSLVVFDLAGTTIEDHDVVGRALVDAVSAVGGAIGVRDANAVMGLPKPVALARLLARSDRRKAEWIDSERVARATAHFEQAIARHYSSPGGVVPVEGVEDTFEIIRRNGAKVVIDSGFSSAIVDTILARLRWVERRLVHARVGSDEVYRGRPAPDLVYEAMRRTNVSDPKTVAKVGDTPADLGEGDSAGCGWNVGVTYGTHVWAELVKHPHTALIEHLRDLPAVLGLVDNVRAPTRPDRPALRAGRVAE